MGSAGGEGVAETERRSLEFTYVAQLKKPDQAEGREAFLIR